MSDFKQAARVKLRVETNKGLLSPEQLWDLPLEELDEIAVGLSDSYDQSGAKSFLKSRSVKDKKIKLALDVVLDILGTKMEEAEVAANKKSIKEHNQKIMAKIQAAKDKDLDNMTVEELESQLK